MSVDLFKIVMSAFVEDLHDWYETLIRIFETK